MTLLCPVDSYADPVARGAGTTVHISVTIHPQITAHLEESTISLERGTHRGAMKAPCVQGYGSSGYTLQVAGSAVRHTLRGAAGEELVYHVLLNGAPLAPSVRSEPFASPLDCSGARGELAIELVSPFTDDVDYEYRDVLTLTVAPS